MRFNYHKSEDALYIRFDESAYAQSDEVEEGKIVGIEILEASKKLAPSFRSSISRNKVPLNVSV